MQIIFRYFAADKFVRKEDGGAVRRRAATRRDTPFEADVRPRGGGAGKKRLRSNPKT